MDLGLDGVRALVFGSSSGLGRAVAAALVAEGAAVAVVSRELERATSAADAIGAAVAVTGDLTVAGDGTRMVADAAAALGGLDICVVNTGGGRPGGILDTSADDDDGAYAAMLRPVLEIARAAAGHLAAGGRGRLVFLTARSVVEATPDLALSSVMRSGVAAAARSLALELAPDVLVNVVVTGQFETPALDRFEAAKAASAGTSTAQVRAEHVASIPLGRLGRAAELADVVTFLCSARASFVTGTTIRVDGGAVRGF
jgi:NAD(P)-dependent dehydrogenase (short-subunit alcohol dehydrogenase family)